MERALTDGADFKGAAVLTGADGAGLAIDFIACFAAGLALLLAAIDFVGAAAGTRLGGKAFTGALDFAAVVFSGFLAGGFLVE